MTDKERIEVYVNELPNNCAECEHCTKAHEGKFGIPFCNIARMPIYNGQDNKGRGHHTDSFNDFDCPLKTIQSVQNQKVVEALGKVKQSIAVITAEIIYQDCRWLGKQAVYDKIDQLISELGGNDE